MKSNQMRKLILIAIIPSIFLTSCATILNSKNQKVTIKKNNEDKILVNKENPSTIKGKYLLKRNGNPKQITVETDGYMDRNVVVGQHKKSPLYILSWIPFGALFLIPPLMDNSQKSYNYPKEIDVTDIPTVPTLPEKSKNSKELQIKKVSVDLDTESMRYHVFRGYDDFLAGSYVDKTSKSSSPITLDNTSFSNILNEQLKDKGYIDTNQRILKNSYINNMLLKAEIVDIKVSKVQQRKMSMFWSFIFIDLSIKWELLDYYGETLFTKITDTRSGQYKTDLDPIDGKTYTDLAIIGSIKAGFSTVVNSEEVEKLMNDRSLIEKEKNAVDININTDGNYVSNFYEAVASTVTIKNKDGFGSGFLISDDGYLVTNYHVVSDTAELKVELNDKTKKDVEIVRASKIYDLALLKINLDDDQDLKPFKLEKSKDIKLATEVYAVGTPTAQDLSQSITQGIISGVRSNSDSTTTKLIQTDASVNSGNSGGPLISKDGTVLAVVSSKVKGFSVEGVAFGIPAYNIMERLNLIIK